MAKVMQKVNLRYVFAALAITVVASLLFGNSNNMQVSNSNAVEEQVTLQLWFWDPAMEEAARTIALDFNRQQPNIDIEISLIAWADYWARLQSSLHAGNGPDLFWMNHPNAASFMPSGLLKDLTDFAIDLYAFQPIQLAPFMYNERLFGLPIFYDTLALFYNRELFTAAGLAPPPRRGWSWEEMREAAIALTDTFGEGYKQFGLGISHGTQVGTASFIFQAGGHIFKPDHSALDINNPGALEALQFMHALMYIDRVSPNPLENADINALGELFVSGLMAMEIQGLWRLPLYYEFLGENLGIAHLPGHVMEANSFHSLAYTAAANSRYPEALKAFLEYAASSRHGEIVSGVFLPSHKDSMQHWLRNYPSLDLRVFTEAMEIAKPLQIASVKAGPVWDVLADEMKRLFVENDSISADLLEAINEEVNAIIGRSPHETE